MGGVQLLAKLGSVPNVIGSLKETKAFKFSPHKELSHAILNEVSSCVCLI